MPSLVGSEMCIRDRSKALLNRFERGSRALVLQAVHGPPIPNQEGETCRGGHPHRSPSPCDHKAEQRERHQRPNHLASTQPGARAIVRSRPWRCWGSSERIRRQSQVGPRNITISSPGPKPPRPAESDHQNCKEKHAVADSPRSTGTTNATRGYRLCRRLFAVILATLSAGLFPKGNLADDHRLIE